MLRPAPRRFRPEALFQPRSVAVLGVDTDLGRRILRNLESGGFKGELQGVGAADELASPPDLAVIATPDLHPSVDALTEQGAGVAIAATAGEYRGGPLRILGPGALGVIVPGAGLNASSAHLPARPGKLALISPSTALCRAVLDWA